MRELSDEQKKMLLLIAGDGETQRYDSREWHVVHDFHVNGLLCLIDVVDNGFAVVCTIGCVKRVR